MAEQTLTPPGAQVQAASLTTATVGLVLWSAERFVFRGGLPPEVAAFLVLAVPYACGRLGAELAYRSARRRLDCPKAP